MPHERTGEPYLFTCVRPAPTVHWALSDSMNQNLHPAPATLILKLFAVFLDDGVQWRKAA